MYQVPETHQNEGKSEGWRSEMQPSWSSLDGTTQAVIALLQLILPARASQYLISRWR